MKCEKCGNEINNESKFCQSCGSKIEEVIKGSPREAIINSSLKACSVCNEKINEDSRFCPNCGSENKNVVIDTSENTDKGKLYQFQYEKEASFGRRIIHTTMDFKENKLTVEQKLIRFLRKTQISTTEVEPADIISIRVKKRFDLWSIIWSILLLVVGFMGPFLFLIIPLFLWMGYHKDLNIYTRRGILRVPAQFSNDEFESMMKEIRQFNPKLIVNF